MDIEEKKTLTDNSEENPVADAEMQDEEQPNKPDAHFEQSADEMETEGPERLTTSQKLFFFLVVVFAVFLIYWRFFHSKNSSSNSTDSNIEFENDDYMQPGPFDPEFTISPDSPGEDD